MLRTLGVIPARYGSTRFPGKMLADINGKPLFMWTYDGAKKARKLDHLIVATDDERIADVAERHGIDVMMTSPKCKSGTERTAEVAKNLTFYDVVINIQGDEPMIKSEFIDQLIEVFEANPQIEMATITTHIRTKRQWYNPNVVKVVTDINGFALYFSRSPIPSENTEYFPPRKHIGIYGYRRETLLRLAELEPTPLELAEKLEQLRAVENGIKIFCLDIPEAKDLISVDTKEDIELVKKFLHD